MKAAPSHDANEAAAPVRSDPDPDSPHLLPRAEAEDLAESLRVAVRTRAWPEALQLLGALEAARDSSGNAGRWEALWDELENGGNGLKTAGPSPAAAQFLEKLLWLRADQAHSRGDAPAEEKFCLRLKERFDYTGQEPEKAAVLHRLARLAMKRGFLDAALEWYRAALYLRCRLREEPAQSELLEEMAQVARAQGNLKQTEVWLDQSLGIATRLGQETRCDRLLAQCGAITWLRGKLEQAEAYFRRGLELRERRGDEAGQAEILAQLGALCRERGQPAHAQQFLRRGCQLTKRLGLEAKEAELLAQLGEISILAGGREEGEQLYRQSLSVFVRLGDKRAQARVLTLLGTLALEQRKLRDAETRLQQALRAAEGAGDEALAAGIYHHLGNVAFCSQSFTVAQRHFKRSLEMSELLGLELQQADLCYNLGLVAEHEKQFRDAGEWYAQSLRLGEQLGHDHTQAQALRQLAHLAFVQQHFQVAEQWCQRLLQFWDRHGNIKEKATVLYRLGRIAGERHQHDEAAQWFHQALAAWEELGDLHGQMKALEHLAALPGATGESVLLRYEQKLAVARSLGDRKLESRLLRRMGDLARQELNWDAAARWYQQCLAVEEALGNKKQQAELLQLLGVVSEELGQLREAEQLYRRSVDLYGVPSGRRPWHSAVILRLAQAALDRRAFDEAMLWFQQGLSVAAGDDEKVRALHGLGRVALELGDPERAVNWLNAALQAQPADEQSYQQASIELDLGRAEHIRRDFAKAERHYRTALQRFEAMGNDPARARALHKLGLLAEHESKLKNAEQLYAEAEALFLKLEDSENLARVREHAKRVQAALTQ